MKISKDEIIDNGSLLGHMVLHGVANFTDVIEAISEKDCAEISMTVNGKEIDIRDFIEHWESQVSGMIKDEAKNLVEEHFETVREKMDEVTETLDGVIGNLLYNGKSAKGTK